tara:strand:- start:51 stop:695 length:645 start_codon:yes stop_codon:yes gene_type:complete
VINKMIKLFVYLMVFLMAISFVFAASVSRDLPSRADPNSELTVKLQVSGADSSGSFTLEEDLPDGITLKDWTVTGSTEAKNAITTRDKEGRFGWTFTPSDSSAIVEYTIDLGSSDVSFGTLVFFDAAGQGKTDSQTLRVAPITCGDGICEGAENSDTCVADCPKAAPPAAPPAVEEPKAVEAPGKAPVAWLIAAVVVILGIVLIVAYQKKKQQV